MFYRPIDPIFLNKCKKHFFLDGKKTFFSEFNVKLSVKWRLICFLFLPSCQFFWKKMYTTSKEVTVALANLSIFPCLQTYYNVIILYFDRQTGQLESFHQLVLKYCSKRNSNSFPVYIARNQLAAIDNSLHLHRDHAYTKMDNKEL